MNTLGGYLGGEKGDGLLLEERIRIKGETRGGIGGVGVEKMKETKGSLEMYGIEKLLFG